jgi:hypothetical protein
MTRRATATGAVRPIEDSLKVAPLSSFRRSIRGLSTAHSNDPVQQRGRLQWLQTLGNRNAGPVCCNGWFGPETLNAADYRSSRPPRPGSPAGQAFGGPESPPDFRPTAKKRTAKAKNVMPKASHVMPNAIRP